MAFYDLVDEQNAYKRQFYFDPQSTKNAFFEFAFVKITYCKDITLDIIASIKVNGERLYKDFPKKARNKPNSQAWWRQLYIEEQNFKMKNSA